MIRTGKQRSTTYSRALLVKHPELKENLIHLTFEVGEREPLRAVVKPTPIEQGTIMHFAPQKKYQIDGYVIDGTYMLRSMRPA